MLKKLILTFIVGKNRNLYSLHWDYFMQVGQTCLITEQIQLAVLVNVFLFISPK